MNTNDIVVEIDAEISRLQQARALLSGADSIVKRKPGRPAGTSLPKIAKVAHTMSTEGRAKIAAAQRARWAKTRNAAKKEAKAVTVTSVVKSPAPNGIAPKRVLAKKTVSVKKAGQSKAKTPVL
jgi:hypothetical protein